MTERRASMCWMDFITGRITHKELRNHIRRQHDPMDCPATGGRHTEHRGEPNQNGEGAIYCTDCGYRWSYRQHHEDNATITVRLTPEQVADILCCPGPKYQGHKLGSYA